MENKVYILDSDILNDDEIYNKLYSALSSYRQEKIEHFRFRKDKNLSLGAGVLIDVMLIPSLRMLLLCVVWHRSKH